MTRANEELALSATVVMVRWKRGGLGAISGVPWLFRSLQRVEGVLFSKFCGCGRAGDFSVFPDMGRWLVLLGWRDAGARAKFRASPLYRTLQERAEELLLTEIEPVTGKGEWGGSPLFSFNGADAVAPGPLAVITRASISPRKAVDFWRHVPPVRESMKDVRGLILRVGFGEFPIIRQATFSIWESHEAMRAFAYRMQQHREVITLARERGWYTEELFGRFSVLETTGSWGDVDTSRLRVLRAN